MINNKPGTSTFHDKPRWQAFRNWREQSSGILNVVDVSTAIQNRPHLHGGPVTRNAEWSSYCFRSEKVMKRKGMERKKKQVSRNLTNNNPLHCIRPRDLNALLFLVERRPRREIVLWLLVEIPGTRQWKERKNLRHFICRIQKTRYSKRKSWNIFEWAFYICKMCILGSGQVLIIRRSDQQFWKLETSRWFKLVKQS